MARILMIEDNADLRLLYRLLLEDEGFEIVDAACATEALQVLAWQKIDAIVLDLRLPDTNGLHLMSKILSQQPRAPIVINTAYDCFRQDFHSWGAEAFVVKSSDASELINALGRVTAAANGVDERVSHVNRNHAYLEKANIRQSGV